MPFRGIIAPLPLGTQGLTGTHNMAIVRQGQLLEATNVSYDTGALRKEGGCIKLNAVALTGAVIGGFDWWPPALGQRQIVITQDGKCLKDDMSGNFATSLATGLTIDQQTVPIFVEGGAESVGRARLLFIFTGNNQVKALSGDGAAIANITTPPADWAAAFPKTGVLHGNRLWGAGNSNDPHRLYYSDTANHQNFTSGSSGTLAVYPGEGETIIAMASLKNRLVVFKYPKGIYEINTSDPTITNWTVTPLTRAFGIAGPGVWSFVDDDVCFMDVSGILHILSAVREFGDFGIRSVSNNNDEDMEVFVRDMMNLARLPYGRAIFYAAKRELHFALPLIGATYNNSRLVVDFNQPNLDRYRFSSRDVNQSIWLYKDTQNIERPMIGDDSGFIRKLDQTAKSKDGAAYTSLFRTPHWDLSWLDNSLATKRKNFQFLELVVEPTGNWSITFDIYYDGKYSQTITFNMGVNGVGLGTFTLGTDILGNAQIARRKKRITGSGTRIQLVGSNGGAGEDFSIYQAFLHCTVGDERI